MQTSEKIIRTQCCIAGGGPAGIMLGFLLAKEGIDVVVLEKWGDFLRDFRGDTIHPSTMEVLYELGLLKQFLALPHDETRQMKIVIGGREVTVADFTHLKVQCPFVAFVPQSDFLNFISGEAKKYPGFHLLMDTEAIDIIEEEGSVKGVKAKCGDKVFDIRAEITVGADGRHSLIREKAGLEVETLSVPTDVLWFKMSRKNEKASHSFFYLDKGNIFLMLNRNTYWQCGFIIKKGAFEVIKSKGIEAFKQTIAGHVPMLSGVVDEIENWEQVKLLTVVVDRLKKWYKPGLICIGDAAHAMSPVGGVGINLAIQDAIATANILIPAFKSGRVATSDLAAIQKRRESPARRTQNLQVFMHKNLILPILNNPERAKIPLPLRIINLFPFLNRLPAKTIGLGFLPEHVRDK